MEAWYKDHPEGDVSEEQQTGLDQPDATSETGAVSGDELSGDAQYGTKRLRDDEDVVDPGTFTMLLLL